MTYRVVSGIYFIVDVNENGVEELLPYFHIDEDGVLNIDNDFELFDEDEAESQTIEYEERLILLVNSEKRRYSDIIEWLLEQYINESFEWNCAAAA